LVWGVTFIVEEGWCWMEMEMGRVERRNRLVLFDVNVDVDEYLTTTFD
jgi:hypothetical protein